MDEATEKARYNILNQPIDPGQKPVIERYYWLLLTLPRNASGWYLFRRLLVGMAILVCRGRTPKLAGEAREFIPLAVLWYD